MAMHALISAVDGRVGLRAQFQLKLAGRQRLRVVGAKRPFVETAFQ
jgi:hypothetical protein